MPTASFEKYRQRFGGKGVRIYSFDLTGYGTSMFPQANICAIAGLNFAVFDLIQQCEGSVNAMVEEIDAVQFTMEWIKQYGSERKRVA